MSSFTTLLEYDKIPKKHFWHRQLYVITAPFEYRTKSGEIIKIEPGFILDFASIPFLICLIFRYSPIGWYAKAVAIHDWGFKYPAGHPKDWWDDIMKEAMTVLAHYLTGEVIPKEMQLTIDRFYYWVQSIFGKWAWKEHRNSL